MERKARDNLESSI